MSLFNPQVEPAPPAKKLRRWLPRPRPSAVYTHRARRVLVLVKGENPTFSYYLQSRLGQPGMPPADVVSIDDPAGLAGIDPQGLFVVVCRYIRGSQLAWLEANRSSLAGVALFLDDDIAALVAASDGSLVYRAYLTRFGLLPLDRLNRLLSDVWVSTPPLQSALCHDGFEPTVLPPAPLPDEVAQPAPVRRDGIAVAYHATDVHGSEHVFLLPVIKAVLGREPALRFEVLARGANRRRWLDAGLPAERLSLLPILGWDDYRAHCRAAGADIFLAPLVDSPLNALRADTKRIDCCRLGAAAVFAEGEVFGRLRRPEEAHRPMQAQAWIDAILHLAADGQARRAAAEATRRSVLAMAGQAAGGLPGLMRAVPAAEAGCA